MFRTFIATALAVISMSSLAAIDVNKATQAELEAVRGVGPALSAKILAERQKTPFKGWPDLIERVRGVGAGNAARLSEAGMTVGGAPYKAAAK